MEIAFIKVQWKYAHLYELVDIDSGIQNLLEVAGTIPEHKGLPISQNSRMHASLCLSKIYDDLRSDQEREQYRNAVDAYFSWVHRSASRYT